MTDRDNEGAIWRERDKASDRHPDFKGNATVNGVEYWVSGWMKNKDAHPKAPSIKFQFTPKDDAPKSKPEQKADEFDDSIPF